MTRMGMVIGVQPDRIVEYKQLHAEVWSEILEGLRGANIRNYSIYLREPENLLFGYWEYVGTDFARDMSELAAQDATKRWWDICMPCQAPLESRSKDEWWASMEEVFHLD